MAALNCDMTDHCTSPITHLDSSGFVYCTPHGVSRREWKPCRKLRPHELRRLRAGRTDHPLPMRTLAIPVDRIDVLPQDRQHFDQTALDELAASIMENGLIQPIIVRPAGKRFVLVAGERRYRAIRQLSHDTIDAHVRELTPEQADAVQLLENIARKSLDPIEEAHAYKTRMDRYGWTIEHLARVVGGNPGTVRSRLDLLHLVDEVQFLVSTDQMPFSHARQLRFLDGNRQRIAMRAYLDHPDIDPATWQALGSRLRTEQNEEAQTSLGGFELNVEEYVIAAREARRPGLKSLLDLLADCLPIVGDPHVAARASAALASYGRTA